MLKTEQAASLSPGCVGYIYYVHRAYDYSGPCGVLWVHIARYKNFCKKMVLQVM